MDVTGKMKGAFTVYGVPGGGVGRTKILDLQADADRGVLNGQADDLLCRLPGGAAGRSANHTNFTNTALLHAYLKLGGAELFAIGSQAALPGETTSGGWCEDTLSGEFFPGCHHRNLMGLTVMGKIVGEIGMF